jgi:acylphosphatase
MELYSRVYTISGRVQGVGFRYHTAMHAQAIGVTGYARNQADGSVEVLAEGNREQVEALHGHLIQGPRYAHVADAEYTESKISSRSYRSFSTG